ncbi:TetR/AcrR family transcriptional regulator [Reyranella humidisoli]|uniref:TetR/AcrR family transcriptional regulator n=1 Tax=Reyranella humidisoli TaxID=2849149 RepID=UPI0034E285EB
MPTALKPRKKPIQTRSTVTVDAIVEATIRILRQDGWAACTTTRIAALAGVSVGSLYQYFPNRNAIAVEIIRQRTRTYLAAVLAADLTGAATPGETVDRAIAAFVIEKRKGLDVSLALRDALPEVQGRQTIIEEARRFVPALQAKLAAAGAGTTAPLQLAVALAAVEGAVWEIMAQDEAAIERPEAIAALSRVFKAAAGFSPAAAGR